jgi:heme A synthase
MLAQPAATARFRALAILTCATTYALVVLGGVVRVTDSGDACPDWPRCHGQLLPPLETDVLIEFSHRLLASVVGFLVVALAVAAWRTGRNAVVRWGALAAVGLVAVQIVLGGITVLSDLSANMVMAHLAVASAFFATLLVVALFSFESPLRGSAGDLARFRTQAGTAALATLALMLTGSYVSGSGAGLAFRDWPLFDGSLLPDGARLAVIHFAHRLAALIVGLYLIHVAQRAWRRHREQRPLVVLALLIVALYGAQAMVGAANIWTLLQPAAAGAHLALAMLVWGLLVALTVIAHRAAWPAPASAARAARPAAGPARAGALAEPARGRS